MAENLRGGQMVGYIFLSFHSDLSIMSLNELWVFRAVSLNTCPYPPVEVTQPTHTQKNEKVRFPESFLQVRNKKGRQSVAHAQLTLDHGALI